MAPKFLCPLAHNCAKSKVLNGMKVTKPDGVLSVRLLQSQFSLSIYREEVDL